MPNYQVAYHAATKTATVQISGDGLPAGAVNIGTFEHADVEDDINDLEFDVNHVFYHHVRDLLYKRSAANPAVTAAFPNNITDMHNIKILNDTVKNIVSINSTPAAFNIAVAATQQIATVFTPADASDQRLTYVSSDPTKATVSATGLVTGVAAGVTNITVTTVEGGKTDVCVATVTA